MASTDDPASTTSTAARFRSLHVPGEPVVLANAWDVGTARMLVGLGAKAIATSSAAHAFTLGRPDGGSVDRAEAVTHAGALAGAVPVPVSADAEHGFGPELDDVAQTVGLMFAAGVAGISIEDTALPSQAPYEFDLAVARVAAAVAARDALDGDLVVCARADGIMTGRYDTTEAIRRLQAFEAVGADVLYAPLPPSWDDLVRIISSVAAPVNVLVAGPYTAYTYDEFARIGAARLSLGSALARVTHQSIIDAAGPIFANGDFGGLAASAPGEMVDELLAAGRGPTASS